MGKKFRSWRRALKRGHLALHNIRNEKDNSIDSFLCQTRKRFGEPNPRLTYMYLGNTPGDSVLEATSKAIGKLENN